MQLNTLTFTALATVSHARMVKWHGPQRADLPGYLMGGWNLSDWMTATVGELGEAANFIKKLNRQRNGMVGNKGLTEDQLRAGLAEELADTAIYLDLMAQAAGIDLGTEIIAKFNRTSVENGFPERLGKDGQS